MLICRIAYFPLAQVKCVFLWQCLMIILNEDQLLYLKYCFTWTSRQEYHLTQLLGVYFWNFWGSPWQIFGVLNPQEPLRKSSCKSKSCQVACWTWGGGGRYRFLKSGLSLVQKKTCLVPSFLDVLYSVWWTSNLVIWVFQRLILWFIIQKGEF